ncbi:NUDIX domain-containing protein [Streptomyces marincola]|uniref:NUDIX domain-containing protein n=1 Tax=Streptomyces marincola TaxID=2878388 RepID=UPI001CF15B6E|nr:NUDIX domain-containing protein [Streptomyces marincola]UCM90329.1 NUDIX domain-containing protein [Streptomyces marincola]
MTDATLAASTMLASAVIVHDPGSDRVALLRRGPGAPFGGGLWDLPVGKCDPGEPVTAAAVRELAEETGLVVDPADLRLAHVAHGRREAGTRDGLLTFLTVVFLARRWHGTLRNAEPHKHDEARWIPVGELPANSVASADGVIRGALAGDVGLGLHGWAWDLGPDRSAAHGARGGSTIAIIAARKRNVAKNSRNWRLPHGHSTHRMHYDE